MKLSVNRIVTPFLGPLTAGWGFSIESLAVQSVGGKVYMCHISAQWFKQCSHLYQTYEHRHRQSPLLYSLAEVPSVASENIKI